MKAMDIVEDPLPEECQYRDEGCDLAPHCLNCPLPRCRYDEPGGHQKRVRRVRNNDVLRLRAEGKGVREVAVAFGLSKRTIQRILRRASHG